MIKNINVEVPQLLVLYQHDYTAVSKRSIDVMNQNFLLFHLSQKFTDYLIRHYVMNEQIREIYLTHVSNIECRITEETVIGLRGKPFACHGLPIIRSRPDLVTGYVLIGGASDA